MKTVSSPLVLEWSPGLVRVFDPLTRHVTEGISLVALASHLGGRDGVIAVTQGSAFMRTLQVPDLPRDEVGKIVSIRLRPLLPLTVDDYVSGFRLGPSVPGQGRLAVVGAMRTESLRRIMREAQEVKLNVCAVTPAAFGSWLVARAQGLTDCAVVQASPRSVTIDLVAHGELSYSRFIPLPESGAELEEEVLRTFDIAGAAPAPAIHISPDAQSPVWERLGDVHSVGRQLFSFDLPERLEKQRALVVARAAQRAVAAAVIAAVLGGFAVGRKVTRASTASHDGATRSAQLYRARALKSEAEGRSARLTSAERVLDRAFHPAQPFADLMLVLASTASKDAWFTGLTLERGKPVLVRGDALTEGVIPKYVDQLTVQPRFRGVKVVFANKATIGKKPVVQFAISGHAVGNVPIDAAEPAKARS